MYEPEHAYASVYNCVLCMHVCVSLCMSSCLCVCMHDCVCMCTYVYNCVLHVYIHTCVLACPCMCVCLSAHESGAMHGCVQARERLSQMLYFEVEGKKSLDQGIRLKRS